MVEPTAEAGPSSDEPAELGFVRRPPVRWLAPAELARTGLQAAAARLFGAYADRRELQAALVPDDVGPTASLADRDEVWIDHVADLGDGFDATYTIASLLAVPELGLRGAGAEAATRRGDILVMGGDQVYPAPSPECYRDRLVGPYRAASGRRDAAPDGPLLCALPGNHDWYDGLTGFLRRFCQGRPIGAWRTLQRRSYFAVELPHRTWLWGFDVQVGADVDQPQLDWFDRLARERARPGDRVILCLPEPLWLYAQQGDRRAASKLAFLEGDVLAAHGLELAVAIAGDLHCLARHEEELPQHGELPRRPRHLVVSGGGGAYLHSPARVPDAITTGEDAGRPRRHRLAATWPPRGAARGLALAGVLLPLRHRDFALVVGAAWCSLALSLESVALVTGVSLPDTPAAALPGVVGALVLRGAPLTFGLAALAGAAVLATDAQGALRWLTGLVHGALHGALALGSAWLLAGALAAAGLPPGSAGHVGTLLVGVLAAGTLGGGALVGAWLALAWAIFGRHGTATFSALGVEDWKGFWRLRLARDGSITLHGVGVRRVVRRWRFVPGAPPGRAWIEPADGPIADRAELVEAPVRIPPPPGR